MTRGEVNVGLAAIVATLADVGSAPEGHIYAALMHRYTLQDFHTMVGLLLGGGYIECRFHVASITDKGRNLAAQIEAAQQGGK